MGNFNPQEFAKIKAEAEKFYDSIKTVYCPALQSEVYFSSEGFSHFQYDGKRNKRAESVQWLRMKCLEEAVRIIKQTTTVQEYRVAYQPIGDTYAPGKRLTKQVIYYGFEAMTDFVQPHRLHIVVRQIENGNFHFWSVRPAMKKDIGRSIWILDA